MAKKADKNKQKKRHYTSRPIIDNTFRPVWRTGEKFYPTENIVGQFRTPSFMDTKFEKIWLPNFLHVLLEAFPSNNGRLLAYILEHRHRQTNIISLTPRTLRPMSQRMIARETQVNLSTVNRFFKKLERCDPPLIRKTGPREYQINPLIIFKGKPEYRKEACAKFGGDQPSSPLNKPHVQLDLQCDTREPYTDDVDKNPYGYYNQIKDKLLEDLQADKNGVATDTDQQPGPSPAGTDNIS